MTHRNDDYKKARKGPFGMKLTPKVRLNPLKFKGTDPMPAPEETHASSVVRTTTIARNALRDAETERQKAKACKMQFALLKSRDLYESKGEIEIAERFHDASRIPAESLATLFDILMSVGE